MLLDIKDVQINRNSVMYAEHVNSY